MVSVLFLPFISYQVPQYGVRTVPILQSYLVFSPTVSPPWLPWSLQEIIFSEGATWCPPVPSLHVLPGATTWRPHCSHHSNLPCIFFNCLSSLIALILSKKSSFSEGRNMVCALFSPFISYLVPQHGVPTVPILPSYLVFSSTVSPP
jgi:hypothetical protein